MRDKKYISFSLWGTQDKYTIGAIENAKLARELFPDWEMVIYVAKEIKKAVRITLENEGARVIDMSRERKVPPCMWRFLIHDSPDCLKFISRDCDSRLSPRDKGLVDIWEASGKACHFIQDHPGHKDTLLAGAWGCTTKFFGVDFRALIEKFAPGNNTYGIDQKFLKHVLWPKAKSSATLSTDLSLKKNYVGQVYNALNEPIEWTHPHWE